MYLKPLPEELYVRLKKDIENTKINEDLILESKNILINILKERKTIK